MLSSRGSITTNVAMVECASGQNKANKDIFLLSELEKVWVSVAVLARRMLLEGKNAQVPYFGTFRATEQVVAVDVYDRRCYARKLCFDVNVKFATKYSVDTSKVSFEKSKDVFSRITIADIVSVCNVPAQTAGAALKEFFLYVGEGLYRGRSFKLCLPGVATLLATKDRIQLTTDSELQQDLYEIDSRKWTAEAQERGWQALEQELRPLSARATSAAGSRPLSRASWRSSSTCVGRVSVEDAATAQQKPVFIAASPSGRTFEEIEKEAQRKKETVERARQMESAEAQLQREIDRRIRHFDCYNDYKSYDEIEEMRSGSMPEGQRRPPTASGESIYCALEGEAARRQQQQRPVATEPKSEVEEVLVIIEDEPEDTTGREKQPRHEERSHAFAHAGRPLEGKDARLEAVLRQEEPFSRPISRQHYHQHSSVRDLIYGGASASPRRDTPKEQQSVPDAFKSTTTPVVAAAPAANIGIKPIELDDAQIRFSRRRFDYGVMEEDHVGSLLKQPCSQ